MGKGAEINKRLGGWREPTIQDITNKGKLQAYKAKDPG